jgi:hypothetical protein
MEQSVFRLVRALDLVIQFWGNSLYEQPFAIGGANRYFEKLDTGGM